ncbi:MAG: ATP-binding cassette domain-containing protein [Labilithrix sp.]|nr:ATP-binding cassette domain-containing protein [Labilithrix sp.]MCW5815166.1 ATP-binding cassette domain-containing protein [Labilithrix sp.]
MSTLAVAVKLGAIDVAFDVPPGVTVLFGPSGAGKSRTLGCIAGLLRPEAGRVALGDEVWFDGARQVVPIHARRVAYVFQSLALFPHMTGAENVAYGLPRDLTKDERRARAEEMLAKMCVPHLADRRPRTFSGGEAQRVALARAFAIRPRVVLLDEPFSALDAAMKKELLREVGAALARDTVPAVLVTHHPEDAEVLGDRVVFMEKGRVTRTAAMSDAPFKARA